MALSIKSQMSQIRLRLKAQLEEVKRSPSLLHAIGLMAINYIRGTTKTGKSVATGKRFKRLAPISIISRRYLSRFNKTDRAFVPGVSANNLTGQFLDSMKHTIDREKASVIIDFPDSPRKPYKTGPKSKQKNPPTNAELNRYLAEQGRVTLGIDKKLLRMMKQEIIRFIRKELRRKFLRRK